MTIRPVQFDDIPALQILLRDQGLFAADDAVADDYWRARWTKNPALKTFNDQPSFGWVFQKDGVLLGFLENIPRVAVLGGSEIKVATVGMSAVASGADDIAAALAAAFFAQDVDLCLGSSRVDDLRVALKTRDTAEIPQPNLDDVLYWIVDAAGYLKTEEVKKGRGAFAAWSVGMMRSVALDFTMRLGGRRPYGGLGNIKPMAPSGVDAAFDDFWQRWQSERPQAILSLRDAVTLRWYYAQGANSESTRILRYDDNAGLRGYLTLVRDDVPDIGLRRMHITDFLVLDNDEKVATSLLAGAYEYATAKRCHLVELFGLPADARALALKHKPYDRRLAPPSACFKADDPSLTGRLHDPDVWRITSYDLNLPL